MKGKALKKQSLYGKIAASVLLKLFISGNEIFSIRWKSKLNFLASVIVFTHSCGKRHRRNSFPRKLGTVLSVKNQSVVVIRQLRMAVL